MVTHSIKGRLVALFVLLALGTSAVFLVGMQRLLQGGWQEYAQPLVADYLDRLTAELGVPPDPARALALTQRLPITVRIDGPVVQFDSHPSRRRDGPNRLEDAELRSAGWGLVRNTADGHRITFGLTRPPDGLRPRLVGWATLATVLLLTALTYWTVQRLLSPLRAIAAGVQAYGRGEFGTAIAVPRRDELGHLAERINGMAANLGDMLNAKRSLLLAISHELRTPLTRARVHAELVEEGPTRSALLRDLGEMRDLITDLLESERLATGHSALHLEPTELVPFVHEVLASSFAGVPLTVNLEDVGGAVQVDLTRLRLLLRNLVGNALRHSAGVAVVPEVFLRREADGRIALGVRDHGAGVAQEQLGRLGQAFYRADAARTRAGGGVGLGLYLCRLVAQAHGGELRIRRVDPGLEVSAVWSALAPSASPA
jgi:signal transduction histidine kinase